MKTRSTVAKTAIAGLIALSITSTGLVFAHQQKGSDEQQSHQRMHGKHKSMRSIFKKLDLSSEQKQQIKDIKLKSKQSLEQYAQHKSDFHEQLQALVTADTFNKQAVIDLKNNNQEMFTNISLIRLQAKHDIYQLLTEEQKIKMTALKEKMKNKRSQARQSDMF